MAVWNWGVDINEAGSMGWVVNQVLQWRCKTLLLGGGGYHSANAARAWTYLTSIALNRPLQADMAIPEHASWPRYAPSFTLEIERGNMSDENGIGYLGQVDEMFAKLADRIRAHGGERDAGLSEMNA